MPAVGNASDENSFAVNIQEQFQLMESFPDSIKRLVWEAPIPMDLREVKAVLVKFGEGKALDLIVCVLQDAYPGWRMSK